MLLESMATGWREHVKRGQVRLRVEEGGGGAVEVCGSGGGGHYLRVKKLMVRCGCGRSAGAYLGVRSAKVGAARTGIRRKRGGKVKR
jgi:hypothetical protein